MVVGAPVVVVVVVDVVVVDVVVVVHGEGIVLGQVTNCPGGHPSPICKHTLAYVGVTKDNKLGHSIYPAGQFSVEYDVPGSPCGPGYAAVGAYDALSTLVLADAGLLAVMAVSANDELSTVTPFSNG